MEDKKIIVLIVAADFAIAKKLSELLYEVGSVGLVLQAHNYSQAVNVLRHRNIAVAVVDIALPGRNGVELLRTMHDADYRAQTLMISDHPSSYYRDLCSSLGASYFFDKSDDFDKIPFIVAQLQLIYNARKANKSLQN
jgi:DNA-binding NarL/FixJ family response regulator